MSPKQLHIVVDELLRDARGMLAAKNKEYSNEGADALQAFKGIAEEEEVSPLVVWRVLNSKGWSAIRNYLRLMEQGKFEDGTEPFRARVLDAIAYLCLLYCLTEDARKESELNATAAKIVQEARLKTSQSTYNGPQLDLFG